MDALIFEWDEKKNKGNVEKHGISFEIAIKVFQDPYRIDWYDEENSGYNIFGDWEDRYIAVGFVEDVLYVVYTIRERNKGEVIRIISARPAVGDEINDYLMNRGDM